MINNGIVKEGNKYFVVGEFIPFLNSYDFKMECKSREEAERFIKKREEIIAKKAARAAKN